MIKMNKKRRTIEKIEIFLKAKKWRKKQLKKKEN